MSANSLLHTIAELRETVAAARSQKQKIGLVPTMGALHEGHLSLARASQQAGCYTVTTIFVNPTQFAPGEDFDRYPRTLQEDMEKLAACGAPAVFAPAVEEMYPRDCTTRVQPPQIASLLEGVCRPGHFEGVATVVLKLLLQADPDIAFFGEKDYQQLLVIRRMARDLNVPAEIRGCPTVREADGLAMSSRNQYLSPSERQQALAVSAALQAARTSAKSGQQDADALRATMRRVLQEAGIERIDYVEIADPQTLQPLENVKGSARALIAAYVGQTRLIDNLSLECV